MPCREEHRTEENRNWRHSRNMLIIRELALRWPRLIQRLQRARFLRLCQRNRMRVVQWKIRQCILLRGKLIDTWRTSGNVPLSVVAQNWEAAVAGEEWKVQWIFRHFQDERGERLPTRATWPPEIPYMNIPLWLAFKYEQAKKEELRKKNEALKRQNEALQIWAADHERRVLEKEREQKREASEENARLLEIVRWRELLTKVINVQKLLRQLQHFDARNADDGDTSHAAIVTRRAMNLQVQKLNGFYKTLIEMPAPRPIYWTKDDMTRWNQAQKQQERAARYSQLRRLCEQSRMDPFSVRVSDWVNVVEGTEADDYPGAKIRIAFSKHMKSALERNPNISLTQLVKSWDVLVALNGQEWKYW